MAETPQQDAQFMDQFEPDVFWQQHGRKIIIGVVGLVVIGLAAAYSQRQSEQRADEISVRLAQANEQNALIQLARENKGKEAGAQALLRLADMQYAAQQYKEASESYRDFVALYPQHSLVGAAKFGQAAILESQGNFEEAKAKYAEAASNKSQYTTMAAKVGVARCSEALGQLKEALQAYQEIYLAVRGSQWEIPVSVRWAVLSRTVQLEPVAPATGAPVETFPPAPAQ